MDFKGSDGLGLGEEGGVGMRRGKSTIPGVLLGVYNFKISGLLLLFRPTDPINYLLLPGKHKIKLVSPKVI